MSNYGRGWSDGYGSQSCESIEKHWDEEALRDSDWEWLDKSPRQQRLRREQGLDGDQYAKEASHE